MASRPRVVVPLHPGSDGDPSHAPTDPAYKRCDPPTLHLEKIATEWMKARGEAKPGVTYILERLPHGYTVFEKARSSGKHIDRWVYGHPDHKTFDSPNRFYPHFEHLMNNAGSSIGCPCSVCVKNGVLHRSTTTSSRSSTSSVKAAPAKIKRSDPVSAPASSSAAAASQLQFKGRPKTIAPGMDTSHVDEEGTPDICRNLINRLKRDITLNVKMEEPMSMDWRADQVLLQELLDKDEPQYAPRIGEIVLYLRDNPDRHERQRQWVAGHVTQVPERFDYPSDSETSISDSRVRVEPIPNPNNGNKSMSKKYQYVSNVDIRPFFLWKHYMGLMHKDEDEWHPTIHNALTCMATISVVGRYQFQGKWPNAQIWCHAIYIGAELIMVDDVVRLCPKRGYSNSTCTDIMYVKSIRLRLSNLEKASSNDYDDGPPWKTEAWLYGSAYTMDPSRSNKLDLDHKNVGPPPTAEGYSNEWYPLHPSNKELAVPFYRILGRVFERDFMEFESLDEGCEAILEGRKFARTHDNRILKSPGSLWYWGDSRAQALDLGTINGLEVGRFDTERDPKEFRKAIKLIDGMAPTGGMAPADKKSKMPDLSQFMAPATGTLPVRSKEGGYSGLGVKRKVVDVYDDDEDDENGNRNGKAKQEDVDSEEDEAQFRMQTMIIDDDDADELDGTAARSPPQKKVKVVVRPH